MKLSRHRTHETIAEGSAGRQCNCCGLASHSHSAIFRASFRRVGVISRTRPFEPLHTTTGVSPLAVVFAMFGERGDGIRIRLRIVFVGRRFEPKYNTHLMRIVKIGRIKNFRLFAIYGWMVFCFIPTDWACFVQNLGDWAFGIIRCIVQSTVELLSGVLRVLNARAGWITIQPNIPSS